MGWYIMMLPCSLWLTTAGQASKYNHKVNKYYQLLGINAKPNVVIMMVKRERSGGKDLRIFDSSVVFVHTSPHRTMPHFPPLHQTVIYLVPQLDMLGQTCSLCNHKSSYSHDLNHVFSSPITTPYHCLIFFIVILYVLPISHTFICTSSHQTLSDFYCSQHHMKLNEEGAIDFVQLLMFTTPIVN